MKTGSILCGGVGSGKSRTAIAYFYEKECGGRFPINGVGEWKPVQNKKMLYIITTAKKRDTHEWNEECAYFGLFNEKDFIVDSWNNIKKYRKVFGAFFIFDEQRVIGSGAWVKAFYDIARKNNWVLLSATPGDTWSDYIPVFVANGFYKNKTDFERNHAIFNPFTKYRKIDRYVGINKLARLRNEILVQMPYYKDTKRHEIMVPVVYDRASYLLVSKKRWNIYDNEPIKETGKLCYLMRRVVNSDDSRRTAIREIFAEHSRLIIFYNYTYELDILREIFTDMGVPIGEWNGEIHTEVPETEQWVYLVQYTAGSEGWNCITTDTIVFYSQSYSYRTTEQAMGRIDRINTPYKNLYYYKLRSNAPIDIAIAQALKMKKNFNEKAFLGC